MSAALASLGLGASARAVGLSGFISRRERVELRQSALLQHRMGDVLRIFSQLALTAPPALPQQRSGLPIVHA